MPASALAGVDYLFLIPPNSAERERRGQAWITAALAAERAPSVLLISVVQADAPDLPASLAPSPGLTLPASGRKRYKWCWWRGGAF